MPTDFDRRDFLRRTGSLGAGAVLATKAFAKATNKINPSRVLGANDRINIGIVGCGGRGSSDAGSFKKFADENNNACQIVAVCDVYEKRKRKQADLYGAKGFLDYRELLAMPEIDAVVVATPDHWHSQDRAGCNGPRQGCLPRKTDVPHGQRGEAAYRYRARDQTRAAGGIANDICRSVVEGQEGDCRRHDRKDDHEPGIVPPQLH